MAIGAFWEGASLWTLQKINLQAILYEWTFYREISNETSYLILCLHINTTVYLDMIENPVEYQKLLWNVSEERAGDWRSLFMSVFV